MAHRRNWLMKLSDPVQDVDSGDLTCAHPVERLLQELRERREPPEFDAETDAKLHELLGCGPRR
jgi:hypothetical protein